MFGVFFGNKRVVIFVCWVFVWFCWVSTKALKHTLHRMNNMKSWFFTDHRESYFQANITLYNVIDLMICNQDCNRLQNASNYLKIYEQKQQYRGMFETQKSGNKTSSGDNGLNIRILANPKMGQDQVSGGVSVLCFLIHSYRSIIIPPATKLGGVYWNHPVRPSVRPSVCLSVCPSVDARAVR